MQVLATWPESADHRAELAGVLTAVGTPVELLVRPPDMDDATARLGGAQVRFHELRGEPLPARARGPVFLGNGRAAWFRGADLAEDLAELAEVDLVRSDLALDGHAIHVDGATALATRAHLLGPRNPGLDARDVTAALVTTLGVEHVIWIDRGLTDEVPARFVAPGVVVCMEPAQGDPHRDLLREVIATLHTARDARGRRLEVFTVPSPHATLAASYTSFCAGGVIVVPQFGVPADERVIERLAPLVDRPVVGRPGRALLGFHASTLLA